MSLKNQEVHILRFTANDGRTKSLFKGKTIILNVLYVILQK